MPVPKVVDQQMIIDEPVVDEVVVIDPLCDLIAGIAGRGNLTMKSA